MGEISDKAKRGLCNAVCHGVGLAGWHGGMGDAFRNDTDFQMMVGGQFVYHPAPLEQEVNGVSADPIVKDIGTFKFSSELYYMHVDPSNDVLATVMCKKEFVPFLSGDVCMPAVWKRHHGNGKVFYSALGHCSAEFRDFPQVFEITVRGILWAAR